MSSSSGSSRTSTASPSCPSPRTVSGPGHPHQRVVGTVAGTCRLRKAGGRETRPQPCICSLSQPCRAVGKVSLDPNFLLYFLFIFFLMLCVETALFLCLDPSLGKGSQLSFSPSFRCLQAPVPGLLRLVQRIGLGETGGRRRWGAVTLCPGTTALPTLGGTHTV